MVRMANGRGPEITLPDWMARQPTPGEWVAWFLEQEREAQEAIADYHLAVERALLLVCEATELVYPRERE
jgi:hypothetical protein